MHLIENWEHETYNFEVIVWPNLWYIMLLFYDLYWLFSLCLCAIYNLGFTQYQLLLFWPNNKNYKYLPDKNVETNSSNSASYKKDTGPGREEQTMCWACIVKRLNWKAKWKALNNSIGVMNISECALSW